MAKFVKPLVLGISLFTSLAVVQNVAAEDSFAKNKAAMLSTFNQSKQDSIDAFENSKLEYLAQFNKVKQELAKTWDSPELTSRSTWVQYSQDNTVKRAVNFETGKITVEVVGDNLTSQNIADVVQTQLTELQTETTAEAYQKDKVVTSQKPSKLIANNKMLPDVNIEALTNSATTSSMMQNNGLTITRVSMAYPKKNVAKKGLVYLPSIMEKSAKWDVKPELILAIMHTESHFNPMAQSHIPAYGLMQVVPTSAGRDVTKRYLGKEQLLPAEVLFNPEFNIDIGTGYLNILQAHYLRRVNDPEIRTYLAISAYNGGIGAVARHFTGKTSLSGLAKKANTLEPAAVYFSLVNDFPAAETRNYLKKVYAKQEFYKKMLAVSNI